MEYWNPHRHTSCSSHEWPSRPAEPEINVPENEVAASGIVRAVRRVWETIIRQPNAQ